MKLSKTTKWDRLASRNREADKCGGESACREVVGSWHFPLNFRELVRSYLDRTGKTTLFQNNFPKKHFVEDWLLESEGGEIEIVEEEVEYVLEQERSVEGSIRTGRSDEDAVSFLDDLEDEKKEKDTEKME